MKNKKSLIAFLATIFISCISFNTSFAQHLKKANFTGIWILNDSLSDFKGNPSRIALPKIAVDNFEDRIIIQHFVTESSTLYKYKFDNNKIETTGKKTISQIKWKTNDILERELSISFFDDHSKEEYRRIEDWSLQNDGKTLVIDSKIIPSTEGYEGYSFRAVYLKQEKR
jgi:hypothetical protein